jgi:site-specific recombinase XerD
VDHFSAAIDRSTGCPLFPNHRGIAPISTDRLNVLTRELCLKAGIDRGVTTYWMRHTFATRLYRLGMSFVKVSMALRHGKLKNTYVYVHGREDRMRKIVQDSPTGLLLSDIYRDVMGLV